MALTKRTQSDSIHLQVKHFTLWREIKKPEVGCEEIQVTNPKTKEVITKYGYGFRSVSGRATKLVKYDTTDKYATRYFGFKLTLKDGADIYVLDMPYQSQVLRRFLRVARNINFGLPLSLTVFKGKGKADKKEGETGIWFQQDDLTVKAYYTREAPHGMPEAAQDPHTHEWDFRAQHRWLVDRLITETIPDIERAATPVAPPMEPAYDTDEHVGAGDMQDPPFEPSDDDVPF